MITKLRYLIRWIRFHLKYKNQFKNTPGIPCLCSNIYHKYHESLWERKTCELLSEYFNYKSVKTPHQHKLPIKFDLIIENVAVYEPHAIFSSKSDNNSYFAYYTDRRNKLDTFDEYKSLPLIVISNQSDFNKLKDALDGEPTKNSMNQLVIDLLSEHNLGEVKTDYQEGFLRISNPLLLIWGLLGWILAGIIFFL